MKIQNHAVQKIKEIETFLEIEVSFLTTLPSHLFLFISLDTPLTLEKREI